MASAGCPPNGAARNGLPAPKAVDPFAICLDFRSHTLRPATARRQKGPGARDLCVDVARAVAVILDDPAPHIGQIYDLTGTESADLDHYARVFSEALGRPIRCRDVPLPAWSEGLRQAKLPEHLVRHLSAMAELTRQGRYDRMTDTMCKLTGEAPTNMRDFVKLHAAEFKQRGPAHS